MMAIIFDQYTRTFSVVEDRKFTSPKKGRMYYDHEDRYRHLIADGMSHEGAIRRLHKEVHHDINKGQTINAVGGAITGLALVDELAKTSKKKAAIGGAASAAIHGGIAYYGERMRKKRTNIVNDIDKKYRDKKILK